MPEYRKDVLHKTKRSAEAVAKKARKAGVHVRVVKVVSYKLVPTK